MMAKFSTQTRTDHVQDMCCVVYRGRGYENNDIFLNCENVGLDFAAVMGWSVLAGLPRCTTEPLQRVLNAAARLVLNLRPRDHVTPALQQLHWLPIDYRITYKLCLIMHLVLVHTNRAPQYVSDSVRTVSRSN